MTHEITRFSPHQTAKVFAAIYGLFAVCLVPFFWLASRAAPGGAGLSIGIALALIIGYPLLGYIIVALGCLTYNLAAGYVGGIRFDLEAEAVAPGMPSA